MELDDRIYCLQQTRLPDPLMAKLVDADIAYLQDRDVTAERIVTQLEIECHQQGISIFVPKYAFAGGY
jgi:hypothetical protein